MLENPAILWYNKPIRKGRFSAYAGHRTRVQKADRNCSAPNVIKLSGHENTQEKEGKCTLSKLSDIRKRN